MAYGLRYNLQQALRDGTTLLIDIYEDGYTGGSIYNYEAISVSISPNTNTDEVEPGIISSELNISFLMSTQSDYDNFPDLLNFNDRKYYVEVIRSSSVIWRGFMFNDYVTIPFSTGTTQVDVTCIDALSFLKYIPFAYPDNVNTTTTLLIVILGGLNALGFKTLGNLYSCCSYYGSSMNNRGTGTQYEPFAQTYIYKRDLVGKNYYDMIEQVVKSFGCRLFQYNGDWWITSANEMASSTVYYTLYDASSNAVIGSGTLSNGVTIEPYSSGNIHFIGDNQNKITRKGYPVVKVSTDVVASDNYTHNSTFKQGSTFPTGWTATGSSGGVVTWLQYSGQEFNIIKLEANGGLADLYAGNAGSTDPYCPTMYAPGFTYSFDAIVSTGTFHELDIYVSVNDYVNPRFWLQADGTWSFSPPPFGIKVGYTNADQSFQSFSRDINLGQFTISGTSYNVYGKLAIQFQARGGGTAYIRNPRVSQKVNPAVAKSLLVTRTASTASSLTKEFTSYLGLYKSDIPNMYGALYYSDNSPITSWYRYSHPSTSYAALPILLAREYSNLFNKNYATLEGDLGKVFSSLGIIYLPNTYTVSDSSTSALSYTGKKFIANRITSNPYTNQSTSLQLLEITDTDNSSIEKVEWIVS